MAPGCFDCPSPDTLLNCLSLWGGGGGVFRQCGNLAYRLRGLTNFLKVAFSGRGEEVGKLSYEIIFFANVLRSYKICF